MGWKPVTRPRQPPEALRERLRSTFPTTRSWLRISGNINLVKVSSILRPETAGVDLPRFAPGALVPTAYAAMTSRSRAKWWRPVGWAGPADPTKNGVIQGNSTTSTREEAERAIVHMLAEAFRVPRLDHHGCRSGAGGAPCRAHGLPLAP